MTVENLSWTWLAGIAVLGLVLVLVLFLARKPRYRRSTIMTENEREFYGRLLAACPDCQIWPQVPILALVRPDAKEGSRAFWMAFKQISNTRVDWVILQDMEVLAIVELDDRSHDARDRSHDARKDAQRDRILKSCGYRVVRFNSGRRPDPRQIHEAIFSAD
ncbi:DUF2726 domain-containing protein [Microvirga splendida]|uniref:DUF2726 domain-containing protein n=1 Tax=Microvirga splendida TaxID=2795727 RepID=A0ABS0Y6E6_9HYPH|nr:DUF2726 domain-containing protein [Microvirga splendida]MBJ6127889.1 DUF2726 domain-containing protein [Microvirga splendida]